MPRSAALALADGSDRPAGAAPVLGGVLGFLRLIWAMDHALQLVSRRMEAERGVTGQQRLLIRILAERPRLSPGQLAEVLHLDPSTVTGIVGRLERKKLVKRMADPSDGRRVIVTLTERGRSVNAPDPHAIEGLVGRALSVFPRPTIAAAEAVLRALAQVLEQEAAAPPRRGRGLPLRNR